MSNDYFTILNQHLNIGMIHQNDTFWDDLYDYIQQEFTNIYHLGTTNSIQINVKQLDVLLCDAEMIFKNREYLELLDTNIEMIFFYSDPKKVNKVHSSFLISKDTPIDSIALILQEVGRRLWYKRLLYEAPDEIMVRDLDGMILFASKKKEQLFGANLIRDYCFKRFEKKPIGENTNKKCSDCPGERAIFESKIVRTNWKYKTTANLSKHRVAQEEQSVELTSVPISSANLRPVAIMEICRDISLSTQADMILSKLRKIQDIQECIKLFMKGLRQLGYIRARLYLSKQKEINSYSQKFNLIYRIGRYPKTIQHKSYLLKDDTETMILKEEKRAILFRAFEHNPEQPYSRDSIFSNLYIVGQKCIKDNKIFKKKMWIGIPIFFQEGMIGKVTIDKWAGYIDINTYELEVLGYYINSSAQIFQNLFQIGRIQRRANIEKIILDTSKNILNYKNQKKLLTETVKVTCERMGIGMSSILLLDEEKKTMERVRSYAIDCKGNHYTNKSFKKEKYSIGENITGVALKRGESVFINDLNKLVERDKKYRLASVNKAIEEYEDLTGETVRNALFIPLYAENEEIGVFRLMNKKIEDVFESEDFNKLDIDIYELLGSQISIAIYNKRLQKQKDDIYKEISHAVFNPLKSIVIGSSHLVKLKNAELSNIHRIANSINRQAWKIEKYSQQILELSRIDLPNKVFELTNVDVNILIKELINSNTTFIDEKNISILFSFEKFTNIKIKVDFESMLEALDCLLSNSIRLTPPNGEIKIDYRTVLKRGKSRQIISIEDTGPGISKLDYKRVWDKYYSGQNKGTLGIGLTVARKIIKKHNGRIDFENIKPTGCKFTIELPTE